MARRRSVQLVLLGIALLARPPALRGEIRFADSTPPKSNWQAGSLAQYVETVEPAPQGVLEDGTVIIESAESPAEFFFLEEGAILDGSPLSCADGQCGGVGSYLFLESWLAQGFTGNTRSPTNRFNTPVTFNDRSNEYQMNQLYLSLGHAVNKEGGLWDIGGQVDFLYGTDYFFTTALGLETHTNGSPRWNGDDGPRAGGATLYGLAMPQLFAEVFAPWGSGLSVKMGHFYTNLGYETVTAPHNFFYSHSYTMQYGEPFTHTGMLAQYDVSPWVALQAGLVRGWNNWEDPNGEGAFIGGLRLSSFDERSSLAFAIYTGKDDPEGQNDRTVYSLVLAHHFSPCVTYVFQHDFGTEAGAEIESDFRLGNAKWYGINQYLYVAMTPTTSMGMRFEWFRDQDNARVLGIPIESQVEGGNYTELTFGVNWKPSPMITLRPELRWDWSDVKAEELGLRGMFNDFLDTSQITLAADLIIRL